MNETPAWRPGFQPRQPVAMARLAHRLLRPTMQRHPAPVKKWLQIFVEKLSTILRVPELGDSARAGENLRQ